MFCWPKDCQANNGNRNCARLYDVIFVDKDPADNINMFFTNSEEGNLSINLDSDKGFVVFPEDGDEDEGAIH